MPLCRQQNHPCKLDHGGYELDDNPSEEWPEGTNEGDVIQLQEVCCNPEGPEKIKDKPGCALTLNLRQLHPIKESEVLRSIFV
jgi:hypothetical protein